MTQPGYRHRIIVQDRSGSMKDILAGAQSGLSEFFDSEAQVPGRATYSLWDFDTKIRCVHSFAPLQEVRDYEINPRGGTAMFDAVGDAVLGEGETLAGLTEEERPEDVTVLIASDGLENSSRRRTGEEVRRMLEHQQEAYKWRVIYMGTNQDAFKEAARIGVAGGQSLDYANTNAGAQGSWAAASSYLTRTAAGIGDDEFTEAERKMARGEH
jgi:hypothetical protein